MAEQRLIVISNRIPTEEEPSGGLVVAPRAPFESALMALEKKRRKKPHASHRASCVRLVTSALKPGGRPGAVSAASRRRWG